jgi:prepilin-type N-terminal cleavage/methylation domain-containing protein
MVQDEDRKRLYTCIMNKRRSPGFTLLELMIVVAAIGILAGIAIPKFAELMNKSKEGALKGHLASLRGAVTSYYADHYGTYPADLDALTSGAKYLKVIPKAVGLLSHGSSNAVLLAAAATDVGGWVYNNVSGNSGYGTLTVNCTHSDSKGQTWTSY